MTAAVVGAGPVGLFCAAGLAERGYEVVVVDPEVGPAPDGTWRRHGVMQFHHPHFFRHLVRQSLEQHVPWLWEAVVHAGGVVNAPPPDLPVPATMTTLSCRRSTFEAALRGAVQKQPRVAFRQARAERVLTQGDRVSGLVLDDGVLEADLVVVAQGRSGRLGEGHRPDGESSPCGQSYVSRMYRARPGVEPLACWVPTGAEYRGYLAIAFPQDDGTLSALFVRRSADKGLAPLWHEHCFDAAAAVVPNLAPWTDPERFEPITPVMRGGTLTNSYRGQGTPPAGLYFVGDTVCTTNPSGGRGVTLGLQQVGALLDALAEHSDPRDSSAALDAWCDEHLRPWYDDHLAWDASVVGRWAGEEPDVEGPLPPDVVCAAAAVQPALQAVVGPYQSMLTPPSSLAPLHEPVRTLLRAGWRPQPSEGPSRDELVDRIGALVG